MDVGSDTMKRKLGVALSGGGMKAYVEIGVLRVLEQKNLKIDCISGTSMGSVIAALTACGANVQELTRIMLELEKQFIDKQVFLRPNLRVLPFAKNKADGFIDADIMEALFQKQLDQFNVTMMSDVKMPLVITAVDLISGKLVIFTNVPKYFVTKKEWIIVSDVRLADAVRASCTVPIVFNTKKLLEMQLVDGGVKMNLPVSPLRSLRCNRILSISLDNEEEYQESSQLIDVATRIITIMAKEINMRAKKLADYNINVDVSNIAIFDVGKGDQCIEIGYGTANEKWSEIEAAMAMKGVLGTIKEEIDKLI